MKLTQKNRPYLQYDRIESFSMILNAYSERLVSLIKQRIQIENMYPETPLECWDSHHAEQWIQLCYDIDAIKEFEGSV